MSIETLADLIAELESNNNKFAIRYESQHVPKQRFMLLAASFNQCSVATSEMICKTSWGKYQIMGDTLYAMSCQCSIGFFMSNEALQNNYFDIFNENNFTLRQILIDPLRRMEFARKYNGPGNVTGYANRIVQMAKKFGLEVAQ